MLLQIGILTQDGQILFPVIRPQYQIMDVKLILLVYILKYRIKANTQKIQITYLYILKIILQHLFSKQIDPQGQKISIHIELRLQISCRSNQKQMKVCVRIEISMQCIRKSISGTLFKDTGRLISKMPHLFNLIWDHLQILHSFLCIMFRQVDPISVRNLGCFLQVMQNMQAPARIDNVHVMKSPIKNELDQDFVQQLAAAHLEQLTELFHRYHYHQHLWQQVIYKFENLQQVIKQSALNKVVNQNSHLQQHQIHDAQLTKYTYEFEVLAIC
ncbi:unnamed protein product [Paramecium octaurelia]|uniref:Uncharacterized protein n=1 Tax=Paramecium octaurelia TaxID=43137 RepID=A0A8S1WTS8_PAROT|nr:unnamed protein product [Paramecium octaurelia]